MQENNVLTMIRPCRSMSIKLIRDLGHDSKRRPQLWSNDFGHLHVGTMMIVLDDDDDDDDDLPAQIHIQRLLRQRRRSGTERKWTEKKIYILQRKENANFAKKMNWKEIHTCCNKKELSRKKWTEKEFKFYKIKTKKKNYLFSNFWKYCLEN